MSLILCPQCHRHVKSRDLACPFCRCAIHGAARPTLGAAVALGLGLAVGGCSSTSGSTEPVPDAQVKDARQDTLAVAAYAAPTVDAGHSPIKDAGCSPCAMDAYGTPPVMPDGGAVAAYAAPAGDF